MFWIHGTSIITLIMLAKSRQNKLIPAGQLRKKYKIPVIVGENFFGLFGVNFQSRRTGINYKHLSGWLCPSFESLGLFLGYATSNKTDISDKLDNLLDIVQDLQEGLINSSDSYDLKVFLRKSLKQLEYGANIISKFGTFLHGEYKRIYLLLDNIEKIINLLDKNPKLSDDTQAYVKKYLVKARNHLYEYNNYIFTEKEKELINNPFGIAFLAKFDNVKNLGTHVTNKDQPNELAIAAEIPLDCFTFIFVASKEQAEIVKKILEKIDPKLINHQPIDFKLINSLINPKPINSRSTDPEPMKYGIAPGIHVVVHPIMQQQLLARQQQSSSLYKYKEFLGFKRTISNKIEDSIYNIEIDDNSNTSEFSKKGVK